MLRDIANWKGLKATVCILLIFILGLPDTALAVHSLANSGTGTASSFHHLEACPGGISVDTFNGNLIYSRLDLAVPGRGLSTEALFSYNSQWSSVDVGYGYGWQFSYGMWYVKPASEDITVVFGDGSFATFAKQGKAYR